MIEITLSYKSSPFSGIAPTELTPERLDNGWRPTNVAFRRNDDGRRFVDLNFETGEDVWEWMNQEGFELDEIEARIRWVPAG